MELKHPVAPRLRASRSHFQRSGDMRDAHCPRDPTFKEETKSEQLTARRHPGRRLHHNHWHLQIAPLAQYDVLYSCAKDSHEDPRQDLFDLQDPLRQDRLDPPHQDRLNLRHQDLLDLLHQDRLDHLRHDPREARQKDCQGRTPGPLLMIPENHNMMIPGTLPDGRPF